MQFNILVSRIIAAIQTTQEDINGVVELDKETYMGEYTRPSLIAFAGERKDKFDGTEEISFSRYLGRPLNTYRDKDSGKLLKKILYRGFGSLVAGAVKMRNAIKKISLAMIERLIHF